MRYLTKEWYEQMQGTGCHLLLKVTEKAAVYSEKTFKKLYAKEEKVWADLQKDISEVCFEDIFPESNGEILLDDGNKASPEMTAEYNEMRKCAYESYLNRPEYNEETEKKLFKTRYLCNLRNLKNELPEEIQTMVADMRVLALNYCTAEVKKAIAGYSRANENAVKASVKAYDRESEKSFKKQIPEFLKEFGFHDCDVISCRKRGGDIVLTLDNAGGFTRMSKIIFKNCTVLEQDARLSGAWWLYEEVYKVDGGYEIHTLLKKRKLIYFTVRAEDVVLS